jgi:subtilase family serine protease
MTDTASNTGTASARATTTRFYLSVDSQRSADDRLMTGTRTVPSLVPGASSTATLTVSVPATMRAGAYFVIACADDTGLVIEASETNNCAASPGPVQVLAADLLESAVTDPPSILVAGNSSSKTTITDTVINQGQIAAGSSTTRYYLSLDALKSANDIRLSATRPIAALGPGISSTGSVSATAPSSAPEGLYYLLACADDTSAVTEGDETNNCRASALQVRVTIPDLAETAMTEPPVSALVGQVFQITDTVTNLGTGTSKASTTRYYLSHNTLKDDADSPLSGSRAVPALAPGGASTGTINVSIPAGTASGTSFVLACADDNRAVTELSEVNNCRASTVSVAVTGPDLTESSLVNPPASVAAGGLFTVTDTTVNQGSTVSPATTTRYYLSADALKDASDKLLTGARAVGPLQVGASVGGPLSIGIPVGTTPGNYLLLACCDDTNAAAETSETNNCRAGTTPMQVTVPDLVITLVGEPPPFTISGDALTVSETVSNIGTSGAAGSTTQYYFSVDSQRSADDVPLTGSRAVPAIASGASSAGTANVLPPTTLAAGSYYLIACADNLGVVSEGDETNNCRSSLTATTLRVRDLTESAVSNPPAGLPAGSSFTVTDTALNRGGAAAAGSTTRYYLAVDRVKTLSSLLLTGSRPVPSLAAGASSAGSATVGIPAGARAGAFFLLACADDIGAIPEVDETNNCAASSSTITVQVMDLRASAVSDPPATTVAGNGNFTFPITDTVVNQGQVTAGSSTTRYYLSRDTLKDGADVRLSATRAVPSLPPGASSTGTVTANANSAATEGFYFVLACADDTDSVVEGDETNNCRASASQVRVILPDMIESGVSASAGSVGAGRSFTASDTAVNSGLGTAKGSTTRYYLSIDSTWTAADLLLQGTRSVPGLAAAASSTGTASVTVPAGTAAGLYYFFACADDPSGMTESNETNNCTAAATRLQVTP